MLCWFKVRSWLQAREICGSGTGGQSFYRETGADGSDTPPPPPPPQPNFQSCNASLKTKLSLMVLVKEVENIFRFFTFQGRRVRNDENRKKKKSALFWFDSDVCESVPFSAATLPFISLGITASSDQILLMFFVAMATKFYSMHHGTVYRGARSSLHTPPRPGLLPVTKTPAPQMNSITLFNGLTSHDQPRCHRSVHCSSVIKDDVCVFDAFLK